MVKYLSFHNFSFNIPFNVMARPQCDTPLVHITLEHQMVVLRPQYNVISIQWYANIKLKMFKSPFIKVSQTIGISY